MQKKEEVKHNDQTLAVIIYKDDSKEAIEFFTPDEYSLQVGKHNRPKGNIIKPHRHCPVHIQRDGSLQEVLYIEEGKVKIIFYTDKDERIGEKVLSKGDMILLMEGGHGFEFLEQTKMIEIKQGPYMPEARTKVQENA